MNGKLAKKCRRIARRDYKDVVKDMLREPWYLRLQFAWFIVFHPLKRR